MTNKLKRRIFVFIRKFKSYNKEQIQKNKDAEKDVIKIKTADISIRSIKIKYLLDLSNYWVEYEMNKN